MNDLNTYQLVNQNINVTTTSENGEDPTSYSIGFFFLEISVRRKDTVRNLKKSVQYLVRTKCRFVVDNKNGLLQSPTTNEYINYPAYLKPLLSVWYENLEPTDSYIYSFEPRTVNSGVSMMNNANQGTNENTTNQFSQGSATTTTNSYNVSLSGGFFGETPTGSLGFDYQRSKSEEQSSQYGLDFSMGGDSSRSSSSSMSVKDWMALGQAQNEWSVEWLFAQEYPWNPARFPTLSQSLPDIPDFIQQQLMDSSSGIVYPPSDLSIAGLDFTVQIESSYIFEGVPSEAPFLQWRIEGDYCTASHGAPTPTDSGSSGSQWWDTNSFYASLNPSVSINQVNGEQIDLSKYGLDPIKKNRVAAVGFSVDPYWTYPETVSDNFLILSANNDLRVEGQGFTASSTTAGNNNPLTCSFTSQSDNGLPVAQLTIGFKVTDLDLDYELNLIHWVEFTQGAGELTPVALFFTINDTYSVGATVNTEQNDGGLNNCLSIDLRDTDLSSRGAHDYLQLGWNTIVVEIGILQAPSLTNSYVLSAVGVSAK